MAPGKALSSTQAKQPLFSFGVITDVQYADIPDGRSFIGVPRHYRHSLQVLQRAITKWNSHTKLNFSLNFGDIVDGFCPKDQSFAAVKRILDEFSKFSGPVFHMIGNHCLYNLPRTNLTALFNIPSIHGSAHYEFSPSPEYRFVILDAYDISAIGWPRDDPKTSQALRILHAKNPNEDKNNPGGLSGRDRRFVMFNGGIGSEQLSWLDNILKDSTERDQKVIICCHLPLDPAAAAPEALLWNYDEVIDVIHRYRCVKACLSGHDHKGGYAVDSHGVHHRVLEAAVECPPGSNAFGYVDVYHDRLTLVGADRMVSTEMVFEA
ncbi:manganese-dependent ADP-ribose/CDP-alcohol diphosphatase [Phalaenopsis equestris]|uniref:manganese-dependent ADP-ribose/CDP-alcohol diphosphatase n=1 Tax=Phalaenopsis equestris TaxID=78828 RepID=UPI0009E3E09B|nr:manganese-dependent ADP-ribose/CDP-alcohol diphosphatase [Phalaenopsis equestris]XP_020572018.1 manganese-dependent ADP-ribose/CDP-alcohol diphosphatase [Phalaenopsis equestris]